MRHSSDCLQKLGSRSSEICRPCSCRYRRQKQTQTKEELHGLRKQGSLIELHLRRAYTPFRFWQIPAEEYSMLERIALRRILGLASVLSLAFLALTLPLVPARNAPTAPPAKFPSYNPAFGPPAGWKGPV